MLGRRGDSPNDVAMSASTATDEAGVGGADGLPQSTTTPVIDKGELLSDALSNLSLAEPQKASLTAEGGSESVHTSHDATWVRSLKDAALRQELIKLGQRPGPVVKTTRRTLEIKLMQLLGISEDASSAPKEAQPAIARPPATESPSVSRSTPKREEYFAVRSPVPVRGRALTVCRSLREVEMQAKDVTGATFMKFRTPDDAAQFLASQRAEHDQIASSAHEGLTSQGSAAVSSTLNDATVASATETTATPVPSPRRHRDPRPDHLLNLMRAIRSRDDAQTLELLTSNPRFLMGGEMPTPVHPGTRQTALHMCAELDYAAGCTMILSHLESQEFWMAYAESVSICVVGTGTTVTCEISSETGDRVLVNHVTGLACTPDDIPEWADVASQVVNARTLYTFNTPMHMAVGEGAVAVVRILAGNRHVQLDAVNGQGQTALAMAVERRAGARGASSVAVADQMKSALEQTCFVPLLRSDDAMRAQIGSVVRSPRDLEGVRRASISSPLQDSPSANRRAFQPNTLPQPSSPVVARKLFETPSRQSQLGHFEASTLNVIPSDSTSVSVSVRRMHGDAVSSPLASSSSQLRTDHHSFSPRYTTTPSASSRGAADDMRSPHDSPLRLRAFAGPMTQTCAENFHRTYRTPPSLKDALARELRHLKGADPTRGYEKAGRLLADKMGVQWTQLAIDGSVLNDSPDSPIPMDADVDGSTNDDREPSGQAVLPGSSAPHPSVDEREQ